MRKISVVISIIVLLSLILPTINVVSTEYSPNNNDDVSVTTPLPMDDVIQIQQPVAGVPAPGRNLDLDTDTDTDTALKQVQIVDDDQWLSFSEDLNGKSGNFQVAFQSPNFVESDQHSDVLVPGCSYSTPGGAPLLPHRTITLTYPPGTKIVDIRFEALQVNSEQVNKPIRPTPEPLPVSSVYDIFGDQRESIPEKDMEIYGSDRLYPEQWYEYSTGMGLNPFSDERTLFLVIHIFPVKYNPVQNYIDYLTIGEFDITTQEPEQQPVEIHSRSGDTGSVRAGEHDMIIICPNTFASALTDFAKHKTNTGVDTVIVTLGDISSGKYFQIQGRDQAEQIKYFIYNAVKQWDIKYVLLAGDVDRIPTRITHVAEQGLNDDEASDLYFADVFGSGDTFCNWDYNNNDRFGEYNSSNIDHADLYPDVHIGRFPASSAGEVAEMVAKTKNYEIDAIGQTWYNNAVLCGLDTFSGGTPEGEYLSDHIASNYLQDFNVIKLYASTGTLSKQNVKTNWNSGAGFISFSDHGLHSSWGNTFSSNDVKSLTNGNKLPFVNLDACLSGEFDQGSTDCLAEQMMLNPNGGAVAVVASSRIAYGSWGPSHINSVSGYLNVRLYHNFKHTSEIAGTLLSNAKNDYIRNVGAGGATNFKTIVEYNYFGDPSLLLGGLPTAIYNLKCENNQTYLNPGESTEYYIQVENTDIQTRQIQLSTSTVPAKWSAQLSDYGLTMQPGKKVNVTLTVTVADDALAGFVADIKVIGSLASSERTICQGTRTIVKRIYGLEILSNELNNASAAVFPGNDVNFTLQVINLGNSEDTISLKCKSLEETSHYWDKSFSKDVVTLPGFSQVDVVLSMNVPAQTVATNYLFEVEGKLQGNSKTHVFDIDIEVIRVCNFNLSTSTTNKASDPGTNVTFDIYLDNLGNHLESYSLSFTNLPEDWKVYFKEVQTKTPIFNNTIGVEPFSGLDLKCIINLPTGTLVGDYPLELFAQCLDVGYDLSSNVSLNLKVNRVYGIALTSVDQVYDLDPNNGSKIIYLELRNLGNFRDSANLEVVSAPEDWQVIFEKQREIFLPANGMENITVKVIPYENAFAGNYNIFLQGIIVGDLSIANLKLEINILRIYNLSIENPNPLVELKAGESSNIGLLVTNLGNDEDMITLYIPEQPPSSSNCQASLEDEGPINLKGYGEKELDLTLTIDQYALAGVHSIPVKGTLGSIGQNYTFDFYFTIKSQSGIELDLNDRIIRSQPGKEVKIEVSIKNTGNFVDNFTFEIDGIPVQWHLRFQQRQSLTIKPFSTVNKTLYVNVPSDEAYHDVELELRIYSDTDKRVNSVVPLTISLEEEKHTLFGMEPDTFYIVVIMIIIILILAGLGVIRHRKREKTPKDDNIVEYSQVQVSDGSLLKWEESGSPLPAQYNPPTPVADGQFFDLQIQAQPTYRNQTNFQQHDQHGHTYPQQQQQVGDYGDGGSGSASNYPLQPQVQVQAQLQPQVLELTPSLPPPPSTLQPANRPVASVSVGSLPEHSPLPELEVEPDTDHDIDHDLELEYHEDDDSSLSFKLPTSKQNIDTDLNEDQEHTVDDDVGQVDKENKKNKDKDTKSDSDSLDGLENAKIFELNNEIAWKRPKRTP